MCVCVCACVCIPTCVDVCVFVCVCVNVSCARSILSVTWSFSNALSLQI